MKPLIVCFLLLMGTCHLYSGESIRGLYEIREEKVPASAHYEGNFFQGFAWQDKLGDNILLLSIASERPADQENAQKPACALGCSQKHLFAYQFLRADTGYYQYWKQRDGFGDCPYALYATYDIGSPDVTDLDADGIAETWYTYKLGCFEEEGAYIYKLMMHEGQQKYQAKGHTTLILPNGNRLENSVYWDKSWADLGDSINDYADDLWQSNVMQDMRNPLDDVPPVGQEVPEFTGIGEKQMTALRSIGYKVPAPTWLPTGYFLEKLQAEFKSDQTENNKIKLLYRKGNQAFVIVAGFDGLGNSDYAGGEGISSEVADFALYYEPVDNGDGTTLTGFATTGWFVVDEANGPSWYVGSGTDAGSKYKLVPKEDLVRILSSLKILR